MKTRKYSIKKNEMALVVVLSLLFAQFTAVAQESVFLDPAEATIIGTPGSWAASKDIDDVNDSLPALFDDDYTTYFNVVKENKDMAWAGLDFGENNNKAIAKFSFILRNDQMSTAGRLDLWKNRFRGAKFYGANSLTVLESQMVDADTVGNLLHTISDADMAHITDSINIREYSDIFLDEPNMDGYRYVLMFFPSGSFGNLADIKFYGFDPTASSLNENPNEDIALLPFNAFLSNDDLMIKSDREVQATVEVYSISGVLVAKRTLDLFNGTNKVELSTTLIENNLYVVSVKAGNEVYSQKLLK